VLDVTSEPIRNPVTGEQRFPCHDRNAARMLLAESRPGLNGAGAGGVIPV
jgi:hypothetical protein